jgi:hypothetical protein
VKKKILCSEQVFVLRNGDGDEREDAGQEGGEQREKILFFFFFPFFLFFSLGQRGGDERTGAVS